MVVEYLAPGPRHSDVAVLFQTDLDVEYWAPDLCLIEAANALRKRYLRERRFTRRDFSESVADLLALGLIPVASGSIIEPALVFADDLTMYDALYAALAKELGLPLCTLDHGLADVAQAVGVTVLLPATPAFEDRIRTLPRRR